MKIEDMISDIVLICHNEGGSDGTTMKNILYYIENIGNVPEKLDNNGELINPVIANEIDLIIRTSLADVGIELSDDEFDSMIDGDLYKLYTSEYVKIYYQANLSMIKKYVENWDTVKECFEIYTEGS